MKISRIGLFVSVLLLMALILPTVKPVSGEPSNTVRVWVTYQKGGKTSVLSALTRQGAELHYNFPELDAYVVTLPEAALSGILRNPFVLEIEPDPVRYPIEPVRVELDGFYENTFDVNGQAIPWGIDAVQARDVWDADRNASVDTGAPTGAGIKVCIVDTGYYTGHEDLKSTEISGTAQIIGESWSYDGAGHGSHVAGTIGAVNNSLGVVGVSPGAVSYHIVKIFNDDGVWATGSDLVAAIYDCQDNGANVISMSLGGTFKSRTEEKAFDALYNAGILHVAAAGNDGNTRLSYPASYSSVISVAAVDSNELVAVFSQQNSAVELSAPGVSVLSTVPFVDQTTLTVDGTPYNAIRVEYSPDNTSASGALVDGGLCTSTGSWNGKVVLCQRGDISFYDKVMNVQTSGGVAAVIYNNEPGDLYATLGEGFTSEILAVGITQTLGEDLVTTAIDSNATVTNTYLKPGSGYEAWDGTSMATPHVSGVAALIWSANPSWSNVQIRNAMAATAKDLGAVGKDNAYGYGLVQAKAALLELGWTPGPTPTETPTEEPTPTETPTEEPTPTETPTEEPTPTETPTETPTPEPGGTLTLELVSPLAGAAFNNKDTVNITISVTDDGTAVANASVSGTVTGPNGKYQAFSGLTDSAGSFTYGFLANANRMGFGTYTIDVTVSKDGYDPAYVTLTFDVVR